MTAAGPLFVDSIRSLSPGMRCAATLGDRAMKYPAAREGVWAKHSLISAEALITEDRRRAVGRSHVVCDQRPIRVSYCPGMQA
jgi:hypothetical protein